MLRNASDFGELPQLSGTSFRQSIGSDLQNPAHTQHEVKSGLSVGEVHYRQQAQAQGYFWQDVDRVSSVSGEISDLSSTVQVSSVIPPMASSVKNSNVREMRTENCYQMHLECDEDVDELNSCLACGAIGGHIDTCTELAPVNTTDIPSKPLLLAPLLRKNTAFTDDDVYVPQHVNDLLDSADSIAQSSEESLLLLMPDICVLRIYSFLDIRSLLNLSSTCRRMHSLHTSGECWRTIELSGLRLTDIVIAGVGARGCLPYVERIVNDGSATYETCVSTKGVQVLAKLARNLSVISLANSRGITDEALYTLARECPNLLALNLKNCRNVTDDGLRAVTSRCQRLSSLTLMGCKVLTDSGLRTVASLQQLRHLNLWQCTAWSENTGLLIFASCVLLETIELRFCKEQVTDSLVEHIAMRCSRLRQLGIAYCNRVTSTALDALMHFSRMHLRALNVRGCGNISVQDLLQYQQKMPECSILYDKG
eukprot:m.420959 g.420959  ORF g.420959 m.420959 type:complete len:481 (-) comp21318_c1_seq31:82-1524(-)